MSGTQSRRSRQKTGELCAATARALTGDASLRHRGHCLHRGGEPLPMYAPHQRHATDQLDFGTRRAAADGMALRLIRSDAELHRRNCPVEPVGRLVFELLEQLRVETLVPQFMPGMARNLRRRFETWSRAFHQSGLTESSLGILLYTVAQMCWSRLNALPVLEDTEDLIEVTRAGIGPALGTALAGMRRWRNDQVRFIPYALEVAEIVAERVQAENEEGCTEDEPARDGIRNRFALLLDFADEQGASFAAAATSESKIFSAAARRYRVFTAQFDVEAHASALVRQPLLREYRERLDALVAAQGINVARFARMLAAIMTVPQRDDWRFGEEEGRIDGRRLAQVVSSPAERRIFRRDRVRPTGDTACGILIDCSGSMKGHAEAVATMADIMTRALHLAGIESEVLGFTTGAWNGGRAQREWQRLGRPQHPGRLNEVCHLVFKEADESWRTARPGIAALLKADLFREGVDGEAVDWACDRLLARDVARRVLIVVSDGSPLDSATGLANDAFYLDNHLKEVVARREREGAIEICGLGVGLDLSPYYRRSLAVDFEHGLGGTGVLLDLIRLIGSGRPWLA